MRDERKKRNVFLSPCFFSFFLVIYLLKLRVLAHLDPVAPIMHPVYIYFLFLIHFNCLSFFSLFIYDIPVN